MTNQKYVGVFDGFFDAKACGWLSGTGSGPVSIKVVIDDQFVELIQADIPRPEQEDVRAKTAGFNYSVPLRFHDGIEHDLYLQEPQSGQLYFGEGFKFKFENEPSFLKQYFDLDWYTKEYSDLLRLWSDPFEHYCREGISIGLRPNEFFDPAYYCNHSQKASLGVSQALTDYATRGWSVGLDPSQTFSVASYLKDNVDVLLEGTEPLRHFIQHGQYEGRDVPANKKGVQHSSRTYNSPEEFFNNPALSIYSRPNATKLNTGKSRSGLTFDPSKLKIAFVIPDFLPGAGGHMAIFKMIYWLEFLGHSVDIWINYPHKRTSAVPVKNEILTHFQPLKSSVRLLDRMSTINVDLIVCTDASTVWSAQRHGDAISMVYFVQDYEPFFFPHGSFYLLGEETYKFGLPCFCSSPWLKEKMTEFGARAKSFIYPVDRNLYFPSKNKEEKDDLSTDGPVKIAFYARQFTSRRAVELAVLGLHAYHEQYGGIVVHAFGQDYGDDQEWPFPVVNHGVMSEKELSELYRDCDIGVAFSATNYSISTVEMLGCGLPVVELLSESTSATFSEKLLFLAPPNPTLIADTIREAIVNGKERQRRVKNALDWTSKATWPDVAKKFEEFVLPELKKTGVKKAPTKTAAKPKATVVIPTFNPGDDLEQVLQRVDEQEAPWDFDVLVVDSSSTDGSLAICEKYDRVKVVTIAQEEFSHGGTRQRAIGMCESDYFAMLTQDAFPIGNHWLFNLVDCLASEPLAGASFGRHEAHVGANPFTVRDLTEHFDMIKRELPPFTNKDTNQERFLNRDQAWLGAIAFFSDNNSCYRRSVWERLALRNIEFGEDQAYSLDLLRAGYGRVYVDKAAVNHSHDYTPDEIIKRTKTETLFYLDLLGIDVRVKGVEDVKPRMEALFARDVSFALQNHIPPQELLKQLARNYATILGQNIAGYDIPPFEDYIPSTWKNVFAVNHLEIPNEF
ncbi:MAG: glycosyltransferase [Cyanobacteria bacterium P01_F01_bin.53]